MEDVGGGGAGLAGAVADEAVVLLRLGPLQGEAVARMGEVVDRVAALYAAEGALAAG